MGDSYLPPTPEYILYTTHHTCFLLILKVRIRRISFGVWPQLSKTKQNKTKKQKKKERTCHRMIVWVFKVFEITRTSFHSLILIVFSKNQNWQFSDSWSIVNFGSSKYSKNRTTQSQSSVVIVNCVCFHFWGAWWNICYFNSLLVWSLHLSQEGVKPLCDELLACFLAFL